MLDRQKVASDLANVLPIVIGAKNVRAVEAAIAVLRAPEAVDAGAVAPFGYVVLNEHGEATFFTPRDRARADKAFLDYGSRFVTVYASSAAAGIAAPPAASADAVRAIIEKMIREGELPEYQTADDNGLQCSEYVDLVVSVLAALSVPVAGATYTSEDMKRYKNCPNDLEPEDCKNVCGEACSGRPDVTSTDLCTGGQRS